MPTAGHRDSNVTVRYQTAWGISVPDDRTRLTARSRPTAYIVNYADDLVICCRDRAEEALVKMRDIMTKLKLR
jgi:hypothetical protein